MASRPTWARQGIAELGDDVWRGDLCPEQRGIVVLGTPRGHQDFVQSWAARRREASAMSAGSCAHATRMAASVSRSTALRSCNNRFKCSCRKACCPAPLGGAWRGAERRGHRLRSQPDLLRRCVLKHGFGPTIRGVDLKWRVSQQKQRGDCSRGEPPHRRWPWQTMAKRGGWPQRTGLRRRQERRPPQGERRCDRCPRGRQTLAA